MASLMEINNKSKLDWLKWVVVTTLLLISFAANYYYSQYAWPLRLLGGLFAIAIVLGIIFQTTQGKQLLSFVRESRMELRKVVWPTRQETIQTTLIIAVMVVVLAFVLWAVDGLLVWIIGWLTGQRG